MRSTNRRWQNHLRAKGLFPFFLDRLKSHALSSIWQCPEGAFHFPIEDRESDDELTRAFFEMTEAFPCEIYLEITNNCNLSCRMCARPRMTRSVGTISQRLFRRIIDEIAANQPYAHVHYYGIGEPLLDKDLHEKLRYARKRGVTNSVLFTNGQLLLKGEAYKRLLDSGIATLGIDLDGFCQETYGQIRIGGCFERVKEGIERSHEFVRERGLRTRIEIAFQVYPEINEADIGPFQQWCGSHHYEYKLVTLHSWAGLREDVPSTQVEGLHEQHHTQRTTACSTLWGGFMILWDGRVACCFQDADGNEILGDLNEQSMTEIWTSSHREKRREHVAGVYSGLCQNCSSNTCVRLPENGSRLYPAVLR